MQFRCALSICIFKAKCLELNLINICIIELFTFCYQINMDLKIGKLMPSEITN